MITITVVHVSDDKNIVDDFFKSLSASHSGNYPYEIISQDYDCEIKNRVGEKSDSSSLNIYLPNNCLVLGNSWDRYVDYAITNGLPKHYEGKGELTWRDYIIRRMALMDRNGSGLFPDVTVELKVLEEENGRS